jgi:UDP-2,3-diacylglucosamine pyrophosphatase LpxH
MPIVETKAHDYLLAGLGNTDGVDAVKLVARYYNPNIGNNATDRLYIFFPDMHLITRKRRKETEWRGFNHERMFINVLLKLVGLRKNAPDMKFHVYQMGDFIDLWRIEGDEPRPVLEDFSDIEWYLYRGSEESVDARFIVGNHDAWLAEKPLSSTRTFMSLFFPLDPAPTIYATHGDVFDPLEMALPDELQAFFVYHSTGNILEKIWSGGEKAEDLGKLIKVRKETCRNIHEDKTAEIGEIKTLPRSEELGDLVLEDEENITTEHKFLEPARERVKTFEGVNINASVIAHTHHARIAVDETTGFVMMDVGAWVGDYKGEDDEKLPCCQIGVICGNDFRIYQLDPNTAISKRYEDTGV